MIVAGCHLAASRKEYLPVQQANTGGNHDRGIPDFAHPPEHKTFLEELFKDGVSFDPKVLRVRL